MPDSTSTPEAFVRAGGQTQSAAVAAGPQPDAGGARAASRKDNIPRGIYFMIAATVMFALSSAIAKLQVAIYPVGEVMFFRSFSSLVACAAVILPMSGFSVFTTRRPRDHIARGKTIQTFRKRDATRRKRSNAFENFLARFVFADHYERNQSAIDNWQSPILGHILARPIW